MVNMNIQQFRVDTPGIANFIHLNNAGAALMPKPVIEAMRDHLELELLNGGYEAAAMARKEIEEFYPAVARLLNTEAHNIAFTASATDSYNRALSSIPFERGDVILTTNNDYVSNQIAFLQLQDRFGVQLVRAADLPAGGVDPSSVEDLIKAHRPRLVAVTHIPTNSGLIQPVAEIGALCRQYDCLYLVDACQSAGQLPLDVQEIQCDYLTATFRKFLRGPRGAGFLYVSDRVLERAMAPLFLDLHSATWPDADRYELVDSAKRFENWERAYALVLGAKAAVEYALKVGMDNIARQVKNNAAYLRDRFAPYDQIRVLDRGEHLGGIVTVHIPGKKPGMIKSRLREAGINSSLVFRGSALIDFDEKGVEWALRLSPHYYNTVEELDRTVAQLIR
ncbi:aminotransferase class V-fold PLP-dependent enzyme [Flavilitoribacter nigricans]|uniref:Aminotransferase n=1 Tax=Flavilitoribacter nigricans (strain ATCC 23147 / DSM 23189 / NBRC 102662 / NCIMB 1420 / SS-2) TaxID=1122177 RepID=A0A2D0NFD6_FLAN2|nr:aminotransferase class V-fold PLP-dependent enzyme [Flavilitoribacter nigricans]PHN07212.1 aminotransferase [Flavilitoribacter nigricans DSM 23189 = NBRC 102662]